MKKFILIILIACIGSNFVFSQEEEVKPKKKTDRPVSEMWNSGILMDEQTTFIPEKKTLEMVIQHRFGLIKNNGASDLWGIYAPSANTRMGLNYTIIDNLSVGYGITRKNMYSDFSVKYKILEQTRKNTMPIDLSIYANMAIDGRNESVFNTTTADSVYKFANRMSYFTQITISRKFCDWFSFAVNGSFTHYNTVSGEIANYRGMNHDVFGFGLLGRIKFSPQSSIVFHYSMPIHSNSLSENQEVTFESKSNFGIGYQVATATHSFEVFITTANGIIPQDIYLYNDSDWTDGEFRFGFTITRLWGF